MEDARDEFESWAEENGIDLDGLRPEDGQKHRRHHRGMGHHGPSDQDTDQAEV